MIDLNNLLNLVLKASIEAGNKIMEYYGDNLEVELKNDQSPLTMADKSSNEVINSYIKQTEIPIISEENEKINYQDRKGWEWFWLVDPLDGTKEFIKKREEFTVNVALMRRDTPVLGVVYAPAKKELFFAHEGIGSFRSNVSMYKTDITENAVKMEQQIIAKGDSLGVVVSKSHLSKETEQYVEILKEKWGDISYKSYGSSYKICMVAKGEAYIYPRLGPTMEWDVAASHAIALYAGCNISKFPSLDKMQYNKENLLNPWFIVYNEGIKTLISESNSIFSTNYVKEL